MAAADPTPAGPSQPGQPGQPGQRGTLTITDKAIATIARAAVLTTPGVAPTTATTGLVSGALGRDLPRIDVARAGTQVDLDVEVATLWPQSAAEVTHAVRTRVGDQLAALAALRAGAVSVAVVKVVRPSADTAPRRRLR